MSTKNISNATEYDITSLKFAEFVLKCVHTPMVWTCHVAAAYFAVLLILPALGIPVVSDTVAERRSVMGYASKDLFTYFLSFAAMGISLTVLARVVIRSYYFGFCSVAANFKSRMLGQMSLADFSRLTQTEVEGSLFLNEPKKLIGHIRFVMYPTYQEIKARYNQ